MKVILLGTGGPRPDPKRQGPSLAIEVGGTHFLFDAGRGAATQAVRAGISVRDIDSIFITHHHFDHIGNLGDMILSSWNLGRKKTLSIYGPEGTETIVNALIHVVYKRDIAFRLKEAEISGEALVDPRNTLLAEDVTSGLVFANGKISVCCEPVRHGHGLGIPATDWKCLAYRIEGEGKSVTISGDAVDCKGLATLAKNTDALVMCCYLSKREAADKEGDLIGRHILAGSSQAGKIASKANAKKLILTHIREKSDDLMREVIDEVKADFAGDIIAGQDLIEIQI